MSSLPDHVTGGLPMHPLQQLDVARLTSRSVLRVSGPQSSATSFLQGMVTNDMRPLDSHPNRRQAIYAALLSPKGKVLYDLILTRDKDRDDDGASILIDVDSGGLPGVMELLNRYKMRRPVTIEDLSSTHHVFAAFHHSDEPSNSTPMDLGTKLSTSRLERGWRDDPRLPSLGLRGIFESQSSCLDEGMRVLEDEEAFRRHRYSQGVAEGAEMSQAVPLEYSLDMLGGISYTKGCYVGQERISYTHYRGVIRKRCIPFKIQGGGSTSASADQLIGCHIHIKRSHEEGIGEPVGSVRALSGGVGLAVVKMNALGSVDGLTIEPYGLRCVPQQPSWWKEEWSLP